ncbi:MAG: virulence RhuM family protein [Cytophagaceae bacterium]|jgi:hypothetical protein|nr:virulence RhuM family protein [Cytophagaceae bacterium]
MDNQLATPNTYFLIYNDKNGKFNIDVRFENDNIWLTQASLVELYQSSKSNVSEHITHIFEEGELDKNSTVRNFRTVASNGKTYDMEYYNLDLIISLGYRIKSQIATQFRIWATEKLHSYIKKGFAINIDRLKNPDNPFDYFEELEQIIQDIRTSERRFYLKITDIYATSIDYDNEAAITKTFFSTVQNKLHWAISGQTAAEIVYTRADTEKDNMGLTSWRGQRIRKPDVSVAKNYLNQEELQALNDLVEQYLLFAQTQARRRVAMTMQDWITKLHGFLTLNEREILMHAGKISHELAKQHAESEYEIFRIKQAQIPYNTDFENFIDAIEM